MTKKDETNQETQTGILHPMMIVISMVAIIAILLSIALNFPPELTLIKFTLKMKVVFWVGYLVFLPVLFFLPLYARKYLIFKDTHWIGFVGMMWAIAINISEMTVLSFILVDSSLIIFIFFYTTHCVWTVWIPTHIFIAARVAAFIRDKENETPGITTEPSPEVIEVGQFDFNFTKGIVRSTRLLFRPPLNPPTEPERIEVFAMGMFIILIMSCLRILIWETIIQSTNNIAIGLVLCLLFGVSVLDTFNNGLKKLGYQLHLPHWPTKSNENNSYEQSEEGW